MAKDIIKLVGKKGKLTGAEVGTLAIKDMVYQLKNKTDKGLFTEAEIQTAVNSLTENNEIRAYNSRSQIASFLWEIFQKQLYAELLLAKTSLSLSHFTNSVRNCLIYFKAEEPQKMTYREYEALRKEKLAKYFKENSEKVTLFLLALSEVREAYDNGNEQATKAIEELIDQPLTDRELALYKEVFGKDYKEEEKSNWNEVTKKAIEYAKQMDAKNAFLCVASEKKTIEKKTFDKSDFAYDLFYFWRDGNQSEELYKELLNGYKKVIAVGFTLLVAKYFSKDKAISEKATINNLLDFSFTQKELYEKYGYDILPEVLEEKTFTLTKSGGGTITDTLVKRKCEVFLEIAKNDIFKTPLETYEETINWLENINTVYDILATETGVSEIADLKCNTAQETDNIRFFYCDFIDLYDDVMNGKFRKDITILKEALEQIPLAKTTYKRATEEHIERVRELLRSSKTFKEYKNELYGLLVGQQG